MKGKCPKCGKLVDIKTYEEKGKKAKYYYEERPKTEMEKKIEKRLGLPFRHLVEHKCKGKQRSGS